MTPWGPHLSSSHNSRPAWFSFHFEKWLRGASNSTQVLNLLQRFLSVQPPAPRLGEKQALGLLRWLARYSCAQKVPAMAGRIGGTARRTETLDSPGWMEATLLQFSQVSKTKVWDHISHLHPHPRSVTVTSVTGTMVNVSVGQERATEQRLPEEDLPYPPTPSCLL